MYCVRSPSRSPSVARACVCVGNSCATLFPSVFVWVPWFVLYSEFHTNFSSLIDRSYFRVAIITVVWSRPDSRMCANELNVNVPHATCNILTHTSATEALRACIGTMCEWKKINLNSKLTQSRPSNDTPLVQYAKALGTVVTHFVASIPGTISKPYRNKTTTTKKPLRAFSQ